MRAFWQGDFHDWLTLPKELDRIRKRPGKDRPEAGVCHVSTPKPQHLWWRAAPTNELDEILVLGEDYGLRLPSFVEDVRVVRLSQAQVANVRHIQSELPANPATNTW